MDRAKGLAILLVVFGHLVAREDPARVTWCGPLRMVVYLFHTPFFFYLSGYVAMLSGAAGRGADPRRRALRLLLPFLGFGSAILLGKLPLDDIVAVDNPPTGLADGIWALFWNTGHSPATTVWDLVAPFVFSAALPMLLRTFGIPGLVVLGVVLFAVRVPAMARLDRISDILFSLSPAWRRRGGRIQGLALGHGLLSMPTLHALMRAWGPPALAWPGSDVFPI
ncbi:MAG: hypothetical protein EXR09_11485 [Acetobacteraceae bacterium]|nr:hypothetical protein [Acetobacteraceae bacterium]